MKVSGKHRYVVLAVAAAMMVVAVQVAEGQYYLEKTYMEQWRYPSSHAKDTKKIKSHISTRDSRQFKEPPHKPSTIEETRTKRRFRVIQVDDVTDREDYPTMWLDPNKTSFEAPAVKVSGSGGRHGARRLESWGPWGVWSPCSATCGSGQRYRFRVCLVQDCEGRRWELEKCKIRRCRS